MIIKMSLKSLENFASAK